MQLNTSNKSHFTTSHPVNREKIEIEHPLRVRLRNWALLIILVGLIASHKMIGSQNAPSAMTGLAWVTQGQVEMTPTVHRADWIEDIIDVIDDLIDILNGKEPKNNPMDPPDTENEDDGDDDEDETEEIDGDDNP